MIERLDYDGKPCIIGYHTQEFRYTGTLDNPIVCKTKDAWLGIGFYFWVDLEFAHYWGEDFKKDTTGYYDIYIGFIEEDKLWNTVFSEDGYNFFYKIVNETIEQIHSLNRKLTLQEVHRLLKEKFWEPMGISGIIYDDTPNNPKGKNRVLSEIHPLYYKKRIQIVVFERTKIHNFDIHLEEQC
ncbi:hypothetical protein [Pontibacter roseus]|uniref:hypothetical protein n=1 Tax=Pontibacter roseus TaxID=336989 RepID=UPI00035E4536|nr:hypothetical protein [Pontibacter roseus]